MWLKGWEAFGSETKWCHEKATNGAKNDNWLIFGHGSEKT